MHGWKPCRPTDSRSLEVERNHLWVHPTVRARPIHVDPLELQQGDLCGQSPGEACEAAVRSDYAMTRHHDRDRIRSNRDSVSP